MFGFIKKAARKIAKTVGKVPIVGKVATSVVTLTAAPFTAAIAVASGERIDRAALGTLAKSVSAIKDVAPYAQTVISVVPGIGSGVSGALSAGLALAEGKPLDAALVAGVRGALPGGALAQAAFDVTRAVVAGKPIDQIAVVALPLSPDQKRALATGISVAKDLAAGKRVDAIVAERALAVLPADARKAVQIGVAVAQAQKIQALRKPVVQFAVAASVLDTAKNGNPLQRQQAKALVINTVALAKRGNKPAQRAVSQMLAVKRLEGFERGASKINVGRFTLHRTGKIDIGAAAR